VRRKIPPPKESVMKRNILLLVVILLVSALPALAAGEGAIKSCEELKAEIAAKLDAKGVKGYTLAIVKADEVKAAKVVGSCDGGKMKITYERK
jgi:Protein of unknown function (DUF1161)